MAPSVSGWLLGRGAATDQRTLYVLSFPERDREESATVTQVIGWSSGSVASFMIPWEARSLSYAARPEPHFVFVSPIGDVIVYTSQANVEERIDGTLEGPLGRGVIRDTRVIGDHVYATGMGRQVYRRESGPGALDNGRWIRLDAGVAVPVPSQEVVGFTSIDGFSEQDIYAVGWKGEIWHFSGEVWRQADSRTNLKLERVVCAGDGLVYAVGQNGVIIRGRGEEWDEIEQDETDEQFWGAAWYADRFWAATEGAIYRLDDEDVLEKIDIGVTDQRACGWLTSGPGALWSIGPHHVLYTGDAVSWSQVFY